MRSNVVPVAHINMTLLDGKKLSQKILDEVETEVQKIGEKLRLAAVVLGKNPVIEKFVAQKKKTAESIGIDVRVFQFEESITTNELRKRLSEIIHEKRNTGVIVQLPLPKHINVQYILNSVTPEKDVDVLSARVVGNFAIGKSTILPPVVGAVKAFFDEYKIDYKNKYVVVVGAGSLVGRPTALWLLNEGATFSIVRSGTDHPEKFLREADIIISGAGQPKFIKGDMVGNGVVIIDAGTTESEGKIVGDVDLDSVASKASYVTPVPGGVGPVTVAILLKNLLTLVKPTKQ